MKVPGLCYVLCAFITFSVKAFDMSLMTQKIKHIDQKVNEKISKLKYMLDVKLKNKLDDLKEELTERTNDAVDTVVEGGMNTENIDQMGAGISLLHESYSDVGNIIKRWNNSPSTCRNNSKEGMDNTGTRPQQVCNMYQENLNNHTKALDECNVLRLQRMSDLETLRNNTERSMQGELVMHTESIKMKQTTSGYQPSDGPDKTDKMILILPFYSSTYQSWSRMNLDCYTVKDYPESNMGYIYTSVYLRKQEKLMIGRSGRGYRIVLVNVNGTGEKVLKHRIATHGIALHEEEDLVYMSTRTPRHTMAKMFTNGTAFTQIASLPNHSWLDEVAIDKERRLLYVRDFYTITQMTFDGHNITIVARESEMTGLALDGVGNIFYVTNGTLMKFSLEKNTTFPMTRIGHYVKDMVFHDDKIYFSEKIPGMQRHSARIGIVEQRENYLAYTTHHLFKRNIFGFLLLLV